MSESNRKTSVAELIERQKKMNAPKPAPKTEARLSLEALIAEADAARRARWEPCPVVIAGEVVEVEIGDTLTGDDWENLTRKYPVVLRADAPYQYDRGKVARDYPIDRIRIDGEATTVETWQSLLSVLSPDDRTSIEAVMWWIHIGEPNEQAEAFKTDRMREAEAALAAIRGGSE